jgi:hypothetical protein
MIEYGLLIAGLTEVVKIAGCPSKYLPIVAVVIGGLVGYVFLGQDLSSVGLGLMGGLATTGLVNRADHLVT